MLSPDLIGGLRMDINRPIGNGRDDTGEGVVDEPGEAGVAQPIWPGIFQDPNGTPINDLTFEGLDANRDGTVDAVDRYLARQLYARHLYVLMMLLTNAGGIEPQSYAHPVDPNDPAASNAVAKRELTARRLAQWAINAIDFRDADAIMTPFEYDVNPFDGWQDDIDGDLATDEGNDRRVVWGCEYPHLVLTETLAFHDRRVTDGSVDGKTWHGSGR